MSETIGQRIDTLSADIVDVRVLDEKPCRVYTDYINVNEDEALRIVEASDSPNQKEEHGKAKKCVTFNPDDEKIRKFITGDPIIDQQNPFKNGHAEKAKDQEQEKRGEEKKKKTPPPVPTKRSTLSVRKTVTQQLREREREREKLKELKDLEEKSLADKEREQLKNETNNRKKNASKTNPGADDYITTEEVLKQSKYVKTYIKNPDAYFVYDPTVLARLKFEELRDIAGKLPKRKQTPGGTRTEARPNGKLTKHTEANSKPKGGPTFKKCSKPNYPELANLKIRTGIADPNGDYFNPAEVTKNAKKFDERVKKLQISSDDDLDEIDGPLTKSESSDELNQPIDEEAKPETDQTADKKMTSKSNVPGTFTNTISSEEFQAYLESKGLALMPKREINSPTPTTTPTSTPMPTPTRSSTFQSAEERRQQVADSLAALRKSNTKKLSVLQRLSNSLFATRRKTTPKGVTLSPRSVYRDCDEQKRSSAPTEMRPRIVLESQPNGQLRRETERGLVQQPRAAARSSDPIRSALPRPTERSASKPAATDGRLESTPFPRNAERQSLIPRRVSPVGNLSRFNRSASMDRNQIKLNGQRTMSRLESVGQRRSVASCQSGEERSSQPVATSTPVRKALDQPKVDHNEWEQLRAIKEVTDRQLYQKVQLQQLQQRQQQQQRRQSEENIYEHLQSNQLLNAGPAPYFVRGSVQRNTFSGISGRNRQMMILDGTPIAPAPAPGPEPGAMLFKQQQQQQQHQRQLQQQQPPPRCQSVLDELITPSNQATRRGYESENETPVVLRRKDASAVRRIGGLLTREEILEKVKEFCRKSINRAPLPAAKMQPIYERHNNHNTKSNCADISPVSYASVETHRRPGSQLSARPQVPQRVQSLPRSSYAAAGTGSAASPIYAHVNKRNSLLSNDSEPYVSNQQLLGQRPMPNQSLLTLTPTEYVLIQTEDGLQAAKLIDYHNSSLYMQPQYIRASPQGYVRIEELAFAQQQQQQQQLLQQQQQQKLQAQHHQLQNGRATPLILDRSAQQTSQIYWTPQHQRMQQANFNQLTMQKSPRMYPVPAPRLHLPQSYVMANGQQYATVVPAARNLQQQGNRQQQPLARNASDWDCSSEAGEIRRIMDKSF